jgi:transposase
VARKNYTDEFRQRAVSLYESTPGATFKGIAAEAALRAEQVKLSEERDILRQVAKCFAGGTNW